MGSKLLFPDRTIQHAGVVVGMGGIAGHYAGYLQDAPAPGNLHQQIREVGCLTAACLLVRAEDYWKVGGFDEALPIDFQDVDFCLRVRLSLEKVLVYDPTYPLIHRQSASRGTVGAASGYTVARFLFRWGEELAKGDPYYSPHLTLTAHDNSLAPISNDPTLRASRLAPRISLHKAG